MTTATQTETTTTYVPSAEILGAEERAGRNGAGRHQRANHERRRRLGEFDWGRDHSRGLSRHERLHADHRETGSGKDDQTDEDDPDGHAISGPPIGC